MLRLKNSQLRKKHEKENLGYPRYQNHPYKVRLMILYSGRKGNIMRLLARVQLSQPVRQSFLIYQLYIYWKSYLYVIIGVICLCKTCVSTFQY